MSAHEIHADLRREELRAAMQKLMQEHPDGDTIDLMVAAYQAAEQKLRTGLAERITRNLLVSRGMDESQDHLAYRINLWTQKVQREIDAALAEMDQDHGG